MVSIRIIIYTTSYSRRRFYSLAYLPFLSNFAYLFIVRLACVVVHARSRPAVDERPTTTYRPVGVGSLGC